MSIRAQLSVRNKYVNSFVPSRAVNFNVRNGELGSQKS